MTKTCKVCMEVKPLALFPDEKRNKDGKQGKCYSCANEYFRCRSKRADVAAKKQNYREENKEHQNIYNKVYYATNKEKITFSVCSWQSVNKAKVSSYKKSNKVRRKSGHIPLTEAQRQEVESFYWLAKDLKAVTGQDYHVDHIVPLCGKTVCGLHVPWNLQVLPADLNLQKSNKYDQEENNC